MIKYNYTILQQSEEWYAARCGILTASDMAKILTQKKLEYAENDGSRAHLNELLAQRITGYVELAYRSDDMLRGLDDEKDAKNEYEKHYAKVVDCGFITNDKWGFTLGYSPDGLIGDNGLIEIKSRRQKYQVETVIAGVMPDEYRLQIQTGLLVSEREYCDFISYSGGLPMLVLRVEPDRVVQEAILSAASEFHGRLHTMHCAYKNRVEDKSVRLTLTVRHVEEQIKL